MDQILTMGRLLKMKIHQSIISILSLGPCRVQFTDTLPAPWQWLILRCLAWPKRDIRNAMAYVSYLFLSRCESFRSGLKWWSRQIPLESSKDKMDRSKEWDCRKCKCETNLDLQSWEWHSSIVWDSRILSCLHFTTGSHEDDCILWAAHTQSTTVIHS